MMYRNNRGNISISALLLTLSIVGTVAYHMYQSSKSPMVILIAGTSSAGKTSIINELQRLVTEHYTVISIDTFDMGKAFEDKVKSFGWDPTTSSLNDFMDHYAFEKTDQYAGIDTPLSSGPLHSIQQDIANAQYAAFFKHAYKESLNQNIIVDTVFDTVNNYDQFLTIMHNRKIVKVLVYCPLDIIQERIENRNLAESPENHRTAWQAFSQFAAMYKVQKSASDQIVDTISARKILTSLKKMIDGHINLIERIKPDNESAKIRLHVALDNIRQFYVDFIKKFKLNEQLEIAIVPMQSYDIIINTRTMLPEEGALKIMIHMKTKSTAPSKAPKHK